jgi:hypothetical protein
MSRLLEVAVMLASARLKAGHGSGTPFEMAKWAADAAEELMLECARRGEKLEEKLDKFVPRRNVTYQTPQTPQTLHDEDPDVNHEE